MTAGGHVAVPCSSSCRAGMVGEASRRNPGIIRNKWLSCFQSGPALWGYPFPASKQSSPGAAELNWQVLQCLSLPGHVFNRWLPALVCTGNSPCAPGMDSSCFSHSHAGREMSHGVVLPHLMERDENVLDENGSSGSFVRSQALKLCILESSLFLLP